MEPLPLRIYWQPGCTSCLRAKEFLESRGLAYVSINVLADPDAAKQLQQLGVRAVPVVARGTDYVLGQDLAELARFVGAASPQQSLPPAELVERLTALLRLAEERVGKIPAARLLEQIPTRPRRYADLVFHIGMIVQGLLDAAEPRGEGELRFEHFERLPPDDMLNTAALATWLAHCRAGLGASKLAQTAGEAATAQRVLRTYYGQRPLHEVLERSAWHVAQHCRQLDYIVSEVISTAASVEALPDLLQGLPVPQQIWDREIGWAAPSARNHRGQRGEFADA